MDECSSAIEFVDHRIEPFFPRRAYNTPKRALENGDRTELTIGFTCEVRPNRTMEVTVKTRVLIISDTHCAPLSKRDGKGKPLYPPFKAPLPSADLLIHCGDLTYCGHLNEYRESLDMLKEIDAPVKLVIAGNHDLSLDKDFVFSHIGKRKSGWKTVESRQAAETVVKQARDLWLAPDGRARMEGVTLLEEGVHEIDLPNGARINIYASPYTPEFHDFGFAYRRREDRFNPPEVSFVDAKNIAKCAVPSYSTSETPVDFLITHGPPYGRLDETARGDRAGCPHLLRALMRSRPLVCCFGHIHEGWGAERIRWSDQADVTATKSASLEAWKQRDWQDGIATGDEAIVRAEGDRKLAKLHHGVFHDLSTETGTGLSRGEETFLVNGSIMDVKYNPVNAPWVLDIDLPRAN